MPPADTSASVAISAMNQGLRASGGRSFATSPPPGEQTSLTEVVPVAPAAAVAGLRCGSASPDQRADPPLPGTAQSKAMAFCRVLLPLGRRPARSFRQAAIGGPDVLQQTGQRIKAIGGLKCANRISIASFAV